jgi:hypothetical protein
MTTSNGRGGLAAGLEETAAMEPEVYTEELAMIGHGMSDTNTVCRQYIPAA